MRALGILVLALVAGFVALVAVIGVDIVRGAHSQDLTHSNALVVLGAAQFDGRPSPVLENRAAHALALYRKGVAPFIVTVGANQPGDRYTEAGSAARWLRAQGVPASKIITLPVGHDTLTSLRAVAAFMSAKQWDSITVVTDAAHAARSARIANDLGLTAHAAPTQTGPGSSLTLRYFARELASTLHYLAFDRAFVHSVGEAV